MVLKDMHMRCVGSGIIYNVIVRTTWSSAAWSLYSGLLLARVCRIPQKAIISESPATPTTPLTSRTETRGSRPPLLSWTFRYHTQLLPAWCELLTGRQARLNAQ
jgi:hypothetical protein